MQLFEFIIYCGLSEKHADHKGLLEPVSEFRTTVSTNSFLIESQKTVIVLHSVVNLHSMQLQSVWGNQITRGLLPAACRRVPRVEGKVL